MELTWIEDDDGLHQGEFLLFQVHLPEGADNLVQGSLGEIISEMTGIFLYHGKRKSLTRVRSSGYNAWERSRSGRGR